MHQARAAATGALNVAERSYPTSKERTVSNFQYYYESGYLQYYYSNSGFLYTYDDGKTITTSTSSDIYISKSSFTDSQAKSKISSLRPE